MEPFKSTVSCIAKGDHNITATIKLYRDIEIKNERMPRLVIDRLYSAKKLPPRNKKIITVKLNCSTNKFDGIKCTINPSYSFNGDYIQHIKGIQTSFYNGFKEIDTRFEDIEKECIRALTSIHKLASTEDLKNINALIKIAIKKINKKQK